MIMKEIMNMVNLAKRSNSAVLCAGLLALVINPGLLQAQLPARLTIQANSGVTISGSSNTIYTLQYTTNPGASAVWISHTFLKLPNGSQAVAGASPAAGGGRVYRAVALGGRPAN